MRKNIWNIILAISIFGIIVAGIGLYNIFSGYKKAEEEYTEIKAVYTREIADKTEEEKPKREINFDDLNSINEDIVGWIWLEDTQIDYPILQSKDNEEYLHTTFNKTKNSAGSLFVDARCDGMLNDNNTIIHGHNMKDGSMFHILNKYTEKDFYEAHKTFWIYTPKESAEYKIISVYVGDADSDSYYTEDMGMDYEEWLNTVCKKSMYKTDGYDVDKKTITLSTCHGSAGTSKRLIVHLQKID